MDLEEYKECLEAYRQDQEHGCLQKMGLMMPLMKIIWSADISSTVGSELHQQALSICKVISTLGNVFIFEALFNSLF